MMRLTGYIGYHIGLFAYTFLVRIAALWSDKAHKFIKGRNGLLKEIARQTAQDTRNKIWFHCASLGEFEQARPVIERLKRAYPQYAIVITFFSPSGYEIRKNFEGADYVFYLPLDTRKHAEKFVSFVKIKLAFFVKYEIWYHYLKTLKEFDIPVLLISANIRPDHIYVKWYGTFFREMLHLFNHIFSQNERSDELLKANGFSNVSISKDTRFDRVFENSRQVKELSLVKDFVKDERVLVIGSSYVQEETVVEACMQQLTDWKIIIAPHHIQPGRITEICERFEKFGVTTYSALNKNEALNLKKVLVIDNIGMLSSIYQYGDIAFIGGGYGKSGLHNTLEAAVFGMPILFGPNNLSKFPESLDMIDAGAGFVIKDAQSLDAYLKQWNAHPQTLKDIGAKAARFISSQTGATQHIFDYLESNKLV
ncbi:MAG: glycosyltransferase N-terminal domain-containing protein [Bacteroidota bacterium]